MANRSLTWSRAAVIAGRDLRSAPGKFVFVVLSVAVGVAALVGVRGFSESFRSTLTREARSLMAGDLAASANQQPSQAERQKVDALKGQGIHTTWVTETISMASVPPDPVPILVSLKAVDPAEYPYYGKAELDPDIPLSTALTGNSVVVADEFLIRLKAKVGDTLRLGGHNFRIAAPHRAGARPHHRRSRHRPACFDLSRQSRCRRVWSRKAAALTNASCSNYPPRCKPRRS